jgi:hypothetical protein
MKSTNVQDPTVTVKTGPMGGEQFDHPAYGMIGVSRISGHANLYGSDFSHNHFVAIRINKSHVTRSLSHDWPFAKEEIIEVFLSEAQWATFVSSVGIGSGVQCTLHHLNGQVVPELPTPASMQKTFDAELTSHMVEASSQLSKAQELIRTSKLSKTAQDEVLSVLNSAKQNISVNLEFVAESFGNHMEKTTEKAKVEVNAYITQMVNRAGITSLTTDSPIKLISDKE